MAAEIFVPFQHLLNIISELGRLWPGLHDVGGGAGIDVDALFQLAPDITVSDKAQQLVIAGYNAGGPHVFGRDFAKKFNHWTVFPDGRDCFAASHEGLSLHHSLPERSGGMVSMKFRPLEAPCSTDRRRYAIGQCHLDNRTRRRCETVFVNFIDNPYSKAKLASWPSGLRRSDKSDMMEKFRAFNDGTRLRSSAVPPLLEMRITTDSS